MKKTIIISILSIFTLMTNTAIAGGSSWEYRVIQFRQTSPTSAEFSLQRITTNPYYPRKQCKDILVKYQYRPEVFWRKTWSRSVSRKTQNQAFRILNQAFQNKI